MLALQEGECLPWCQLPTAMGACGWQAKRLGPLVPSTATVLVSWLRAAIGASPVQCREFTRGRAPLHDHLSAGGGRSTGVMMWLAWACCRLLLALPSPRLLHSATPETVLESAGRLTRHPQAPAQPTFFWPRGRGGAAGLQRPGSHVGSPRRGAEGQRVCGDAQG